MDDVPGAAAVAVPVAAIAVATADDGPQVSDLLAEPFLRFHPRGEVLIREHLLGRVDDDEVLRFLLFEKL